MIRLRVCFLDIFADSKPGSWILGGGWNNDLWGGELPLASWIDEITPDNPVRRISASCAYNYVMTATLYLLKDV